MIALRQYSLSFLFSFACRFCANRRIVTNIEGTSDSTARRAKKTAREGFSIILRETQVHPDCHRRQTAVSCMVSKLGCRWACLIGRGASIYMMLRDSKQTSKLFIHRISAGFVRTQACVFFGTLDGLQGPLSALLRTWQEFNTTIAKPPGAQYARGPQDKQMLFDHGQLPSELGTFPSSQVRGRGRKGAVLPYRQATSNARSLLECMGQNRIRGCARSPCHAPCAMHLSQRFSRRLAKHCRKLCCAENRSARHLSEMHFRAVDA